MFHLLSSRDNQPCQMRYLLKKKIIYLFLAMLGLHCNTWAFFSCGEQGLL